MLGRSQSCLKRRSGFYIAVHPWLSSMGLCKVGFSASLPKRLSMSNYTTCFSDDWAYHTTIECPPRDAQLLEHCVLRAMKSRRIDGREVVKADPLLVAAHAEAIAAKLRIKKFLVKRRPSYKMMGRKPASSLAQKISTIPKSLTKRYTDAEEFLLAIDKGLTDSTDMASICHVCAPLQPWSSLPVGIAVTPPRDDEPPIVASSDLVEEEQEDQLRDVVSSVIDDVPPTAYHQVALRAYQVDAVSRTERELVESGKAVVQMACRSGKTPVAHRILTQYFARHSHCCVVFLVPGLALLRQTAQKLSAYGLGSQMELLLVGSDPLPVTLANGSSAVMTTNRERVADALRASAHARHLLVISTYASCHLVADALELQRHTETGEVPLSLTVFDEAHRVCGRSDPAPYNRMLLQQRVGDRLFLTATPTYDTPIRMDDKTIFGGIAFRFYLREGIDQGFVNAFGVDIVLGDTDDMASMVVKALQSVDKLLVFCRNIDHAVRLSTEVSDRLGTVATHKCFCAHSRLGPAAVGAALRDFKASPKAVLFNVRLFQEGVEIPDLTGVFFAAPRYSPRDIIQSICRPLNVVPGKPQSRVFLPAHYNAEEGPESTVNLKHFSTLVPFTDALMDEDPTLFEYLIDPHKNSYSIRVVGVRELNTTDNQLHKVVLPAIRRGVRFSSRQTDRLHRAERLPWSLAFGELKRIVLECNRYPKINDAWIVGDARVPMNAFYRYVRQGYLAHIRGASSFLQLHQIRDLETLPCWTTYGCLGPYPWKECLATLAAYIKAHKRFPLLDIHRGGFVGLDATPFERLAGALCNINQQERNNHIAVAPEKQRDLDDVCRPYGLTWRKPRAKNGQLLPSAKSCITECYDEFKRRFACIDTDNAFAAYVREHFPGYPSKHRYMENLAVQASGTAPPRLKLRSEAQIARMKAKDGSTDIKQHVVVCRQCRVEVHASEWSAHVASPSHTSKLSSSVP